MRTRIGRHLRPLLAVVAVAGLAVAAWSQHDAIAAFDWSIDRWQLALSVALFAVAPLLQALTFVVRLRRVGADGPARGLVRVWARSFLLLSVPARPPIGCERSLDWRLGHDIGVKGANRRESPAGARAVADDRPHWRTHLPAASACAKAR